jgi:hypothetical protein
MPPEWAWPLPWEVDAALERYRAKREAEQEERDRTRGKATGKTPPTPVARDRNLLYEQAMAEA